MNKNEFKSIMARNGHNQEKLAEMLGISKSTLSKKLNEKGSEFSQSEIMKIKTLYKLTDKQLDIIFFSEKVSL